MNTANFNMFPNLYQRLVLSPLGLNYDNALVLWLLLISGITVSLGLWYFEGQYAVVLSIFYLLIVLAISILKPDYSLYLLLFLVLIFDQFGIPGFNPLTYQIDFFRNLKEISYIPFFNSGVVNPIEIHLLFLFAALIIFLAAKKDFTLRGIPISLPFLAFVALFFFSVAYGLKNGGDFLVALWEIRALCYLFVVYFLTSQFIRTREQLNILIWVFILGISFKAFQAIGRFIGMGFTTGGLATLTNHEDPVFMVTLFILLLGFMAFKVKNKQYLWLLLLLIPLLLGFYIGLRRAAYASFIVSFTTFMVLLPTPVMLRFLKYVIPCLVGIFIYGTAMWNSNSTLARPVQMIKSGIEKPDKETNYEDYYSNLYREYENYNLAQTVVHNPVMGIGFGQKYEQPKPLVNIRFPLRDYIPHNEIYWVLVKMGAVGFLGFWFFFNSFVAKGTKLLKRVKDPYLKAVIVFIVIAVINQMVVSYFDLQLTYYRNMIYLGCQMGLLTTIERLHKTSAAETKQDNDQNNSEETE
ncbi:O-antigen ligase family protein [Fodinibius sp. AD559]|uniref:O-antigen ligase family protein n=1 Tax=Fodinibius sp. AD559 TaxID=3424179 RepID=UPI00404690E5